MISHRKSLAALLAIALLGPVHAAGPILVLEKTVPPKYPEALRSREVAVLPFGGQGGAELTQLIEGVIASAVIDGRPVYVVTDRSAHLERYQEIERSQRGEVLHDKAALRLGKAIGAKAIYIGAAEKSSITRVNGQAVERVCTQRDTRNNASSLLGTNCKAWQDRHVHCQKRSAVYAFNAKLMVVENGRVLLSDRFESVMVADACTNMQAQQVSDEQLVEAARRGALHRLRAAVIPTAVNFKVEMFPADSKFPDKSMRTAYGDGLAFARERRLDRACEMWEEASALGAPPMPMLYALAVCREANGDLAGAYALYDKADRMLKRPDKRISAALLRTKVSNQGEELAAAP
jgi:hypothetical protein